MGSQRERLPAAVLAAAGDRRGGATEVARQALDGLLEIASDRALLKVAAQVLLEGQPAMAPVWHLARAARGEDPAAALAVLRDRLDHDAEAAAETAVAWLRRHAGPGHGPGPVATVSHSSLVDLVLERLPGHGEVGEATVAVVGSDAIGPDALLNATGTRALADRLPTLVVSIPVKLVPASVFARLAAPGFEAVPLRALAAVAMGRELLSPAEAGRRAAALDE
ncbi:MAG TPA: hypothetical protein VFA46_12900 [Actinomycetes bacterium]|jgi:hypothetical protein|nr:hypothetical protein [Actinomycetes bacterium]